MRESDIILKLQDAGLFALGGLMAMPANCEVHIRMLAKALKDSGVNSTHVNAILADPRYKPRKKK